MKRRQINLQKISKPNKGGYLSNQMDFSIFLGNGYVVKFQSLKSASRFLAETNRIFNQKFDELLALNASIYQLSLYSFRYLSASDCMKISGVINLLHKTLNLLLDRSSWANGNYFVFTHFNAALNELSQLITLIKKSTRPGDLITGRVNSCESNLTGLKIFLDNYPDQPFTVLLTSQTTSAMTIKKPDM